MTFRKSFPLVLLLILISTNVTAEYASASQKMNLDELVRKADGYAYTYDNERYIDEMEQALNDLEKAAPNHPFVHWGRARVPFFRKESLYLVEHEYTRTQLDKKKDKFAKECHHHSDKCIEISPDTPECYLMKGACYAMQASTWGNKFRTLRILKPMDKAFVKAIELPSDFQHRDGSITTRQLGTFLRGVLYRLMPDRWWLKLFAGIRGDKEKAYNWLKESIVGPMAKEPVMLVELAVAAVCFGREEDKPEKVDEGIELLKTTSQLPTRYSLDEIDQRNIRRLLKNPDEICQYRRERFEDLSKKTSSD